MAKEATDLNSELNEISRRLNVLKEAMNFSSLEEKINESEQKMAQAGFWDSQEKAQATIEGMKKLKSIYTPMFEAGSMIDDNVELLELAIEENDENTFSEIAAEITELKSRLDAIELQSLLSEPNDEKNVFFSLHAGAGGSDACECAEMMLRMYSRFFEQQSWKVEELAYTAGDEAGLRSVTLVVKGGFAYGNLKSEIGVHRIVRISPFSGKRETSFVGVDVIPEYDDVEVDIDEKDLRIDTYRAGGKGGQHVNKTDSAVRITHLPTGIVVAVQNERSQHKNKAMALKLLVAKIQRIEDAKRQKELGDLYSEKGEIAFGSQIRNYVFNPYTQVKDSRTGFEVGDVQKVMDGALSGFIDAYLRWKVENKN
ncbi:MAG: peptide chain release factor 2 [Planctomycetota bacterium]|jgi:peptide chain release factor 2